MKITLKNPTYNCPKPDGHRECRHPSPAKVSRLDGLTLEAEKLECGNFVCCNRNILEALRARNGRDDLYEYWATFLPSDGRTHFSSSEAEALVG